MRFLALVWTLVFWICCVAVPLGAVVSSASLGSGWRTLVDPTVLAVVRVTLWQTFWSTALSGFFGLALGLWVGRSAASKTHPRIETLLMVPYGVPTVVVAMAW